jgi:hypothetical protein
MAEPKTRPTDFPVSQFVATLPASRHADANRLIGLMEEATGQPAQMWGAAIVGFGAYGGPKGAKITEWPVVAFSPRADKFALYLALGEGGEQEARAKLGRHTMGKGCLYIKQLADVNETALLGIITRAVQRRAATRVR